MKRFLFKVARSDFSSLFIGFAFEHLTPLMPIDKIGEDAQVIAFYHPVKHWDKHIVIVPKKALRRFTVFDFGSKFDRKVASSVYQIAQKVAGQKNLDTYTVLVNGGQYQDVPQVHFHLASGQDKNGRSLGTEKIQDNHGPGIVTGIETVRAFNNARPSREVDIILSPVGKVNSLADLDLNKPVNREVLIDILRSAQSLVSSLNLPAYTLLTNASNKGRNSHLYFNLVSGSSLN